MAILECFTDPQRTALARYENMSGFEPMHQDEFAAGKMSFEELWHSNQCWFSDLQNEVSNITAPVGELNEDGNEIRHFIDRVELA